jgi:hypothetical protein
MDYKIIQVNKETWEKYKQKWNQFVYHNPQSIFEHTSTYLESQELLGNENCSFIFEKKKKIIGILPLIKEKLGPFRRFKTSGLLGSGKFGLIKKKISGTHIINNEIKNTTGNPSLAHNFILNIKDKSEEHIWKYELQKESRNLVRKALKNNLKIEFSRSMKELKKFHLMYIDKMKDFNVKPYPFNYFEYLIKNFNDYYVANVYLNNKLIAGGVMILFNKKLLLQFAASYLEYLKYAPNNFLYWHVIKFGLEKECDIIDFGPSLLKDNVAKFKKSMGGKPFLAEEHIVLNKFNYFLFIQCRNLILKIKKFI